MTTHDLGNYYYTPMLYKEALLHPQGANRAGGQVEMHSNNPVTRKALTSAL